MTINALNRISADELTLYFWGGVLLIVIPPLVGLVSSWILFGTPVRDGRAFWKRLAAVTTLCLVIAGGLAWGGIALLEPATPQAIWLTMGITFIFGLLGAGQLYWDDEDAHP